MGSKYSFGGYDWRVLDVKSGKILLLSENILEKRAYHDSGGNITWGECTLRQYLNGEFFNKFNPADKNRIIKKRLSNPDNSWCGTKGGNDTDDEVFVLNLEEADRYFGNSGDYLNKKRTGYSSEKKQHGQYLSNYYDKDRVATLNGVTPWWWLRSPGYYSNNAAIVNGHGVVDVFGYGVNNSDMGVRPALWLTR